jgi:hypothetical protein
MDGLCLFGSVAVFAAVLTASSASAQSPRPSGDQPDILFILMDNLGYGDPYAPPHLTRRDNGLECADLQ